VAAVARDEGLPSAHGAGNHPRRHPYVRAANSHPRTTEGPCRKIRATGRPTTQELHGLRPRAPAQMPVHFPVPEEPPGRHEDGPGGGRTVASAKKKKDDPEGQCPADHGGTEGRQAWDEMNRRCSTTPWDLRAPAADRSFIRLLGRTVRPRGHRIRATTSHKRASSTSNPRRRLLVRKAAQKSRKRVAGQAGKPRRASTTFPPAQQMNLLAHARADEIEGCRTRTTRLLYASRHTAGPGETSGGYWCSPRGTRVRPGGQGRSRTARYSALERLLLSYGPRQTRGHIRPTGESPGAPGTGKRIAGPRPAESSSVRYMRIKRRAAGIICRKQVVGGRQPAPRREWLQRARIRSGPVGAGP